MYLNINYILILTIRCVKRCAAPDFALFPRVPPDRWPTAKSLARTYHRDRRPAMRAFPHGAILASSGSFGASIVCSRSSFSNPTMSSPMSSPICTFRNAASSASCRTTC
jgi:hypothetical protein